MTLLSLPFVAIVGLLAVLQWRWLDQLESTERFRAVSQVGYTARFFKASFDEEIDNLARSLAGSRAGNEKATTLEERALAWRESTVWPGLLGEVYVVNADPQATEILFRAPSQGGTELVSVGAPESLDDQAGAIRGFLDNLQDASPSAYQVLPSIPALLVPARFTTEPAALLLELDRAYLVERMCPELLAFTFAPASFQVLDLAIAETNSGRILFSTLNVEHVSQFGGIDTAFGLVPQGAGHAPSGTLPPIRFSPGSPPPPSTSTSSLALPSEVSRERLWYRNLYSRLYRRGHWQLLVRHGEIPVAARVARAKKRGALTAFGLMGLLSAAIAIMVLAERRTRLAANAQIEQLAHVAHELRTPLAVLSSAGDNLVDALVDNQLQLQRYGRQIQKECQRLRELVENVLRLSSRRARGHPPPSLDVDLVRLANAALASQEINLQEEGFTVERGFPRFPVSVRGEPPTLHSAVSNLLSNAIKYGRRGRWLRVAVEKDAIGARVIVEDRGPGIPQGELPRLLQPYARGTDTDGIEGSGLGLAVVREIMDAHSGRISVHNSPGGGATVTLHFPLRPS